jgi:CDP-glucose 4,6-dehydratase
VADLKFYRGKRVFVTGHTGFKGSWLCFILARAGADVVGYALEPPASPSLFELAKIKKDVNSITGDIRDYDKLKSAFDRGKPDVVMHLAAQPIVRESYKDPRGTYETNVMGAVNVLECVRSSDCARSFLNVTTDKVYENREWEWAYRERDPLDGFDPYSNSKSCSELATGSYRRSFFQGGRVAASTARAGNVIGGGDFATDRIIPDCVRAAASKTEVVVRNPRSIRPYQHVLEPLFAYLTIVERQCEDAGAAGCYNVGPDERDCVSTGRLVQMFCEAFGGGFGWRGAVEENAPYESHFLRLDSSRMKQRFGWSPRWHVEEAVGKTVEWTKAYLEGEDVRAVMERQIEEFLNEKGGYV